MIKRSLLVGATIAAVTLGGGGLALAATDGSTTGDTTIVDKIAAKFNLNKNNVQAVFDEERGTRHAEMKANFEARLADGVKDGDLTQAQADHITSALAEIEKLRGDNEPRELSDEVRDQIHDKMDELRDWAKDEGIDMRYVMGGMGRGHHGGFGGHGFGERSPNGSSDDSGSN